MGLGCARRDGGMGNDLGVIYLDFPMPDGVSRDDVFTDSEAQDVQQEFKCGVCGGDLTIVRWKLSLYRDVICIEHGSVSSVGRVTAKTVEFRNRQAHYDFQEVCRNLPDLYGKFLPPKKSKEKSLEELGY